MHQRLLGSSPRYIMLTEPAWSWMWGRLYNKSAQELRRRMANGAGVHLRKSEKQERKEALEKWKRPEPVVKPNWGMPAHVHVRGYGHGWQGQAGVAGYGRYNGGITANTAAPMMHAKPTRHSMHRQVQYSARYPPQQPVQYPVQYPSEYKMRFEGDTSQQRAYGSGWQGAPLAPVYFVPPAVPSFSNPFVSAALSYAEGRPGYTPFSNTQYAARNTRLSNRRVVPSFNNPLEPATVNTRGVVPSYKHPLASAAPNPLARPPSNRPAVPFTSHLLATAAVNNRGAMPPYSHPVVTAALKSLVGAQSMENRVPITQPSSATQWSQPTQPLGTMVLMHAQNMGAKKRRLDHEPVMTNKRVRNDSAYNAVRASHGVPR